MSVVETATQEEYAAIGDLNVVAYAEFVRHLSPAAWTAMRHNLRGITERAQSAEFLVCRSRKRIIGSVAYCPAGNGDPTIFDPDMAAILLLAVHPDHRRKGVAKALAEACISRARKDGAASVGLFTSELMQSAQQVYRSLGFSLVTELPKRHGIRYFLYVLTLR